MMLMEATTLYAYWGNRREGFEACATRMAAMLDSLAAIHPAFETWLRQDPVSKQWSAFGGRPRTIDGLAKDLAADWDEEPEINRSLMPNFGLIRVLGTASRNLAPPPFAAQWKTSANR